MAAPCSSDETDASAAFSPRPPAWESFFNARAGFGYKDNLLLARDDEIGSPFVSAALEAFLWKYPDKGREGHLYASADHRQFLDGRGVHNEQSLLTLVSASAPAGDHWTIGFRGQHFFQNQPFDDPLSAPAFDAVRAKGHSLEGGPSLRRDLTPEVWIAVSATGARQFFSPPLDDYWSVGGTLEIGRSLANESQISLAYEWMRRRYDTRSEVDDAGFRRPDTTFRIHRHNVLAEWRWHIDADRKWRLRSRLRYRFNDGSGGRFFDYQRLQTAHQIQYRAAPWRVSAEARVGAYEYDVQTVSDFETERRRKTAWWGVLRAERTIVESVTAIAELEHEFSDSNANFDRFRATTVSLSLDWEF